MNNILLSVKTVGTDKRSDSSSLIDMIDYPSPTNRRRDSLSHIILMRDNPITENVLCQIRELNLYSKLHLRHLQSENDRDIIVAAM